MKDLNACNRMAVWSALVLLVAGATGCSAAAGTEDEDGFTTGAEVGSEDEDAVTTVESALTSVAGANYVSASWQTLCTAGTSNCVSGYWMKCGPNQIAVGLHKANQQVVCVDVPPGNAPRNDANLEVPGNSHQILGMQSCAAGKYVWAIANSGSSSWLLCRSYDGLGWSNQDASTTNNAFADNGTNSSTSQSGPVYNLFPNAHVCKATPLVGGQYNASAMVGVHLSTNTFACAF
jgi:hypothetical protein